MVAAGTAAAHSGAEVPLFVAPDGHDGGSCLEPATPCASVGYALSVAGKGAEIRVAAGTYEIEDPEQLFHIVSGMVEVVGGFERGSFAPDPEGVSTLTGVPSEYRGLLAGRGFNVVPDRKAIEGRQANEARRLVTLHEKLKAGAATPAECVDGTAGDLECAAVDLLAHFSFADVSAPVTSATDVWGFVDLNTGREYALVGYDIGTAVIDVTEPEAPREVGFVDGQKASWRDIKVYQLYNAPERRWHAYAYVTTDGSTDGLFVIDLTGLPHSIRKRSHQSDYFSAHNVYAADTDYSTGISLTGAPPLLAISGSNIGAGWYRGYTLADPAEPAFVAGAATSTYMHDATSLLIADERASQCENAAAACTVLVDFNEDVVNLWDISDPADPVLLSVTGYPGAAYVHSGWWSEDRRHVFVHDELDEQSGGLDTTVRVLAIDNLAAPALAGSWEGETRAIDHNGFVRGNRYYISNYSRGLTVLDISDPAEPVEAGMLDTYPFSNQVGFVGAWGAYPFFFSDTIAISDINSGLYLARDRSLEVPQGMLAFGARSYAGEEGQTVTLSVRRQGGDAGAVSVAYELLDATTEGSDRLAATGELAWGHGDSSPREISIPLASDGDMEELERFFVKLVDPRGGATLGENRTASVFIGDAGAAAEVRLFAERMEIPERGFGRAIVVLQRGGNAAGAASVDYAVTGGDAEPGTDYHGPAAGTVAWDAGDAEPKNLVFTIVDDGLSEETEFFEVTLTNASGAAIAGPATARIDIVNGSGTNAPPNAVAGTAQTVTPGSSVVLDGSGSNDPDGDALDYGWMQTAGPEVALTGAGTDTARFTAPAVSSDTMLRFRLTVTDPAGLSDSVNAVVTVSRGSDGGGGGAVGWLALAAAVAGAARRVRRKDGAGRSSGPGRDRWR